MASNTTTWKTGQSGNPRGRPPKQRALTKLLENAGKRKLNGTDETAQRLLVERVWQGVTTGVIDFGITPTGAPHVIVLDAAGWTRLAKMVYDQVDGPPKAEMDITSAGQPISVLFDIAEGHPSGADEAAPAHDDEGDD